MKFPYWKLKSVCDGFNYRVVRSEWIPETIEVYSWGKCMENSCKGFLTQLRQFTESVKEDPDWKFVRIEQREKLEKRKSRYLTDLEIKLNQSFQDERRFHPDLLSFRIRAYHEASKMRFVKNYRGVFLNTKTVSFQKRADMEYRRLHKLMESGKREDYSGWDICYRTIKRLPHFAGDQWTTVLKRLYRSFNSKLYDSIEIDSFHENDSK